MQKKSISHVMCNHYAVEVTFAEWLFIFCCIDHFGPYFSKKIKPLLSYAAFP